jgi:TRAP-type C4-dicarboxylate transport system permease large subunit
METGILLMDEPFGALDEQTRMILGEDLSVPIWFGILIVVVVEIGLISPPVGMNLFVINALLPQVPTRTLFHGVLPFMFADVIRLGILIAFPIISLWLPSLIR